MSFALDHVPAAQEWLRFLWLQETPLAGPEAFYKSEMYRYVAATHPSIKAMMIGGGADEFNGGYSALVAPDGWDDFVASLEYLQERTWERDQPWSSVWGRGHRLVRVQPGPDTAAVHDPYAAFVAMKHRDVQQYNCWHEDRSAAGSGIEARVPFLDTSLVEWSCAVPRDLRPQLLYDKAILRRGMHDVLPAHLVAREKVAFFHGAGVNHTYRAFARMLFADGGALLQQALDTPGAKEHLAADGIVQAVDPDSIRGEAGEFELALRLINLGLLESMAQSGMPHHSDSPGAALPERFLPPADLADLPDLAGRHLHMLRHDGHTVAELAEGVELLSGADGVCRVVVDGEIQFLVDPEVEGDAVAMLAALDGVTPLGELVPGVEPEAFLDLFTEAVSAGVISVVSVPSVVPAVTPVAEPAAGAGDEH